MTLEELDRLLPLAFQGDPAPRTEQCLGIRSRYDLATRPGDVADEEIRHFLTCPYCKEQVAALRRNLDVIEAVIAEEEEQPVPVMPCVPVPPGSHLSRRAGKNGTINS